MLGKLIKNEFIAVTRLMLPLHLGLIVITIIGRFYIQFTVFNDPTWYLIAQQNVWYNIINALLIFFYVIALIAAALITWIYLSILRFRKNMDILRALPQGFAEIFRSFPDAFGVPAGVGIPLYLLLFIINSISGILIVYMCIAIGHSFNTHKILASVGVYVGMILVNNLISMIFSAVTGMISYGSSSVFIETANNVPNAANFWLSWSFAMLLCLVTAAAGYLLSNYFMTKRLNLE